jgi:hypothetical protein
MLYDLLQNGVDFRPFVMEFEDKPYYVVPHPHDVYAQYEDPMQ